MKFRKISLKPVIAALAVCLVLLGAGWYWYDNNVDRSGWLEKDGQYFYLDFHGKAQSGWIEDGGYSYYFGPDGAMVTGWQDVDGERLYFRTDGILAEGWQTIDGSRYFLTRGLPAEGWQTIEGSRYYFFPGGEAAVSWQEISGERYYFGNDGEMVTGWLVAEDGEYYLAEDGHACTGLTQVDESTYCFDETGRMQHGWVTLGEKQYYFTESGSMTTGWLEKDGKRYYFDESGVMAHGWLQLGEYRYYLTEDGSAATTPTEIDGETCYFSPKGIYVLLVNYANAVPKGYDADLVPFGAWARVSAIAAPHLEQMIADCEATGIKCWLNCGFRSQEEQIRILDERTEEYEASGMSYTAARAKALETVAVPGYSEHQIGLAVDVVCSVLTSWLIDHCWEYGFILRYPEGKTDITGIAYEHWHFRYVGTEVSLDMKDSGLCLEEYLGAA